MMDVAEPVGRWVRRHERELVAFRRRLHARPELSGEEEQTTAAVEARLSLAGLSPKILATGTGLVCDVGAGDPVVALRADIDALAMSDAKHVPYRSQNPGVAHACGHDVHTAIVLGAGLALAELLPELGVAGSVRLVFEPTEEVVPGGAVQVIREGWLDGVRAMFGVHCDPKTDVGKLGVRVGALTSASDVFSINLSGPGGHTARPHLTVDLVNVLARVALALPPAVQEAAADVVTVVFGSVRAGDAANVIPSRGVLRGTLRTPSDAVWRDGRLLLEQALAGVLQEYAATWSLDYRRGVPACLNDRATTELLTRTTEAILGPGSVVESHQSMGGDSFAWYGEHVPISYARLGTHNPTSTAPRLDLHASTFDVDERAIGYGVKVLTAAALGALAG